MEITTKTSVVSVTKEGLLMIRFLANDLEVDLKEAQAQITAAEKLSEKREMLILVDARDSMHELTTEAKEFIANYPKKKAEAILIKELHQRIIATFYLKLSTSKHKHPVKVFSNEPDAINWLLSLKS